MKQVLTTLFLLFVAASEATAGWHYTNFKELKANHGIELGNEALVLDGPKSQTLFPVLSTSTKSHGQWGIEQVYVSEDLKARVFVKQDVAVSDERIIGGWDQVGLGYVLHFKGTSGVWAFYAVGLSGDQRTRFNRTIRAKVSLAEGKQAARSYRSAFFPTAFAEEALNARPQVSQTATSLSSDGSSEQMSYSGSLQCMKLVLSGAWSVTGGLIQSGAQAIWDFAKDPAKTWHQIEASFQEAVDSIANLKSNLARLIQGFEDFHPEIRASLLCSLTGSMAAGGLMAYLTFGGGGVKLAAHIASFAGKVKALGPFFKALTESGIVAAAATRAQLTEVINGALNGTISAARLRTMEILAKLKPDDAFEAAACAVH